MRTTPKLEVLPPLPRRDDPAALDAFHEHRVRQDLARFAEAPGLFEQCAERLRVRFQKAGERAILERWIEFYQTGERLVAAKAAMERSKSEYLQLGREHEVKETEKGASLAKLQADLEEQNLRRDKAVYQREHLERFVEGGTQASSSENENERQLNDANERRQLDARWDLHESLRALHTLIELQHWRRQQRDRVLQDRFLSSQEQSEDLQFVDDLYEQKRAELKVDTRIFEEG
jgi:hypothetical protein